MKKVMIVGAGKGGTAILKMMLEVGIISVKKIVDTKEDAPGIQLAKQLGVPVAANWEEHLDETYDFVIEVTGKDEIYKEILSRKSDHTVLIPGAMAFIMTKLLEDRENLIEKLKSESMKHDLIFNSTHDGMIVVDQHGDIIVFNKSAERMTGLKQRNMLGKPILEVMPSSQLLHTLESKRKEINKEQVLENGVKIITTRIPLLSVKNEAIGAFAVFKDITEFVNLAEELTNLKEVQTMLEAIIQSSDDAISVVDELGRGLMINPAYTRITGLSKEEVIGKPATTDISEGESMHMQVLQTRRPVRGVNLRVGPKKRDVIVNVAPVIVSGRLKGSVGVIHDVSEIKQLNQELDRARRIIRTLESKYTFEDIIGESAEMKLAIDQARLSARTPATVLLRGESGTGKELFAHAIHDASDRKFNKFVRVNCAAISESLLESELFGYEEGAFTGAKRGGKRGVFEEANNGSIFLDEIGELTANTQAKLLRVLQEHEVVRVGGTKPISINVRVIAATNLNLEKAIGNGNFREDLYFRLNQMPIHISPLRNRKNDIPEIASHLLQKLNQEYGRNIEGITEAALKRLANYSWPGNVRELANILGRAIIFMNYSETMIDEKHIPDFLGTEPKKELKLAISPPGGKPGTLSEILDEQEKEIVKQRIIENNGNKTATAKSLGISVRNLYYKLEKYNLADFDVQ